MSALAETACQPVACQITDHALLRYLERAYRLDVEAIRDEMRRGVQPAIDFGARVAIVHGVRLVIRNGKSVVTTLPKGMGSIKSAHR